MDITTLDSVAEINERLNSTATGTADYGTTFTFAWNVAETELTVTLGTGEDIVGGETVNPASTVTDEAGNPDATTGTGPAIPTPEEEGFVWEWWYTLLIALGGLIIIAAIVLLVVLPKRGAPEFEEELYGEEEDEI